MKFLDAPFSYKHAHYESGMRWQAYDQFDRKGDLVLIF
jgi:hypothetical protein